MPIGVYIRKTRTKEHCLNISLSKKGKANPKKSLSMLGSKNPRWLGGIVGNEGEYISIYFPGHPNNVLGNNYVYLHRVIIEQQIGRYLLPEEEVHHVNEIKDDNRIENLMAFSSASAHHRFHKDPNNVKQEEILFDGRSFTNGLYY